MLAFLADRPLLLLFILLAVGTAIGRARIGRFSLGPAAVLFAALAFSAVDERLALPEVIGTFGLAVFAYTIGVTAGPSFFSSLRGGTKPVLLVMGTLIGAGVLTWGIAQGFGFSPGTAAGLYAGANTNTPGLAAAIVLLDGSPEPTVAYSLTYVGGVLLMLWGAAAALRSGEVNPTAEDSAKPSSVMNATIKVTNDNLLTAEELTYTRYGDVIFSRYQSAGDTEIHMVEPETVFTLGDRVLVIGPEAALRHTTKYLGRRSKLHLEQERTELDYRRMVLSQRRFFGRTVGDLELWEKFGARATRVRRADQDLLATDDFVLQAGDRLRVAAPRDKMAQVAHFLGDSEHGVSDINPLGLATGLAIGLLVGAIPFAIPGLGDLTLGNAAGPLIIGLILGRLGRSGRVVWTMPHQAAETLTQLGLLLFLAYAGGRAGHALIEAIKTPLGIKLILAGLLVTGVHALALLLIGRRILGSSGPRVAGVIAGSQTQPAVLAFANDSTGYDARVALGYALVYPVAMVTKIIVAQILTML